MTARGVRAKFHQLQRDGHPRGRRLGNIAGLVVVLVVGGLFALGSLAFVHRDARLARAEWGSAMTCSITERGNLFGEGTPPKREVALQCPGGVQLHPVLSQDASVSSTAQVWHSRKTGSYFVADKATSGSEPAHGQGSVGFIVIGIIATAGMAMACHEVGESLQCRYASRQATLR